MSFEGKVFLMSFPVEIILKWRKGGSLLVKHFRNHNSLRAVSLEPTRQMCNLKARCITYFTMLVEPLIIKNAKAVGWWCYRLVTGHIQVMFYTL